MLRIVNAKRRFFFGVISPVPMLIVYSLSGRMTTWRPGSTASDSKYRRLSARPVSSPVLFVCVSAPR